MTDPARAAAAAFTSEDIEYRKVDGRSLLARLYRPGGTGPFPAVVCVHGGAWTGGDRLQNRPIDEALAKAGAVVVDTIRHQRPQQEL